ncbi:MAG: 50S ribosomal protein L4 [Chloroflexi bacterium]|nr:50S ribosomal protein L4 [Chloroflexota bacterium]
MVVPMYNIEGQKVGEVELRPEIFEVPINVPLMHQALVYQLASARAGTHKVKTRGENNRTKAKWYRQKGTGRARHGSRNANIFVGGGIAHGPVPRDYSKKMPRKMRRAALRSALSVKRGDEHLVLLDALGMETPKTKDVTEMLRNLGLDGSVLILLSEGDEVIQRAARNLPNVKVLRANYINIKDLLRYDQVLMPMDALRTVESMLG